MQTTPGETLRPDSWGAGSAAGGRGWGRGRRALAARLLRLAAGRRRRRGLGLAVAVALGRARGAGAGGFLRPPGVALQQLLEVLDVADGGAERLHLAEPPVRQLAGQVVSQARVALVHAPHPLPLALVAPAEEGGLEGALQRQGQAGRPRGAAPGRPRPARGVQTPGDPQGVPEGEAGQGPRQVQGHCAEVVRQGQQAGRFTLLHPSPKSKQIHPRD